MPAIYLHHSYHLKDLDLLLALDHLMNESLWRYHYLDPLIRTG